MQYTALSPWARVELDDVKGLSQRLDTLEGKTIGMFSHFKGHSPLILKEIERQIAGKAQNVSFKYLQYKKDTKEIQDDIEFRATFEAWVNSVDGIIAAYGDAGSCAMFHAFNTAFAEKLGRPCVLLVKRDIQNSARRGAAARHMPQLRLVPCDLKDLSFEPSLDEEVVSTQIRPAVQLVVDELMDALVRPLSQEESRPAISDVNKFADKTYTGTLQEICDEFYRQGFTNGMPIIPPTTSAVEQMLEGTPLSPDYVVAELPPMRGVATVEKIAICAVMAGCLPTYMPPLIAAVEAMAQPHVHLTGWTCSVAGFAPLVVLGGPVADDICMNKAENCLSPYDKPSVTISNALNLIIMNISGVRPGLEDGSYTGHESRVGVCFAEDDAYNPWMPLGAEFGFDGSDSTVTVSWFSGRKWFNKANTAAELLRVFCSAEDDAGFAPGCSYVISPRCANLLAQAGYSRDDVRAYISEYARKPARDVRVRWMRENNHVQRGAILPLDPDSSCRKFWNTDHLNIYVAGSATTPRGVMFTGGGDHGGPACARMQLPKSWPALVERYKDLRPAYIEY